MGELSSLCVVILVPNFVVLGGDSVFGNETFARDSCAMMRGTETTTSTAKM